ncbi:MAG TPA: hypothetical protein VGG59_10795 [Acidobacteriaceae bacterium]|jgi:hypothetical protein
MRLQVFHVFFKLNTAGELVPSDPELHALASAYAAEKMRDHVDFRDFKNTWVACEVDETGKPVRAFGILCMQMRADFPICRFTDNVAVVKLVQRANDHLHDLYGARGTYALVHIADDDAPEERCPDYRDWMKLFELVPAERWAIKVR